jgi:hypothetical protein
LKLVFFDNIREVMPDLMNPTTSPNFAALNLQSRRFCEFTGQHFSITANQHSISFDYQNLSFGFSMMITPRQSWARLRRPLYTRHLGKTLTEKIYSDICNCRVRPVNIATENVYAGNNAVTNTNNDKTLP